MAQQSSESPTKSTDYKQAYYRQRQAREQAEQLLENRSSELHDTHQSLMLAYNKLKSQKAQMFHQEKLASIGQLSAGVAHEINNPAGYVKSNLNSLNRYITSIQSALAALKEKSQDTLNAEDFSAIEAQFDLDFILEDIDDLLKESVGGLSRIEEIVRSLKNFARPDQDEFVEFNINQCILDTIKLVNKEIQQKGLLHQNLRATKPITGQPGNIGQVILNLLVNASQAIAPGGNISISTQDDSSGVVVKVEDDGCGIPEGQLKKIFDPFFTTKEVGVGTGLGLSVSHGIIKKHNGRIHASSEPNQGTTFTLFLPYNTSPL